MTILPLALFYKFGLGQSVGLPGQPSDLSLLRETRRCKALHADNGELVENQVKRPGPAIAVAVG